MFRENFFLQICNRQYQPTPLWNAKDVHNIVRKNKRRCKSWQQHPTKETIRFSARIYAVNFKGDSNVSIKIIVWKWLKISPVFSDFPHIKDFAKRFIVKAK